jgi:hypothetical protein
MADTRINALSTATVSLSDDFLPIDGTTAGTKKLSAYSPTFGGNATVGGTLTVTGNATVGGANVTQGALASLPAGAYFSAETSSGEGYLTSYNGTSAAYLPINYRSSEHKFTSNGVVKVQSTTASTTTSSGALVVGNGTSGGLGVGGSITSGGQLAVTGTGTSGPYIANSAVIDYDSSTARFYGRGPNTSTRPSLGFYSTYSDGTGGLTLMTFNTSGVASIPSTTASTSTSSGALVVSGGVGVAGAIYAGGNAVINGEMLVAGSGGLKLSSAGTTGAIVAVGAGGLSLRDDGNNQLLNLADATGNATFLGNITTAAPTGGTAAAWKLGTVASVSPTSPNRTIEVDIGGTIYYIHAKTTNN